MTKRSKTEVLPALIVIADKVTVARKYIKQHNIVGVVVVSHTDLVKVERERDHYEWIVTGPITERVRSIRLNAMLHGQHCDDITTYAKTAPGVQ